MNFLGERHLSQASKGCSFFVVTYNVELWLTSICLLFMFICHLSAIGQVSHSRKVRAFCSVSNVSGIRVFLIQCFVVRIGSMDGCSLYKIKLIIKYARYFDIRISSAGPNTAFLYLFSGLTGILIYLPFFSILDLDKYTFNIVLMCNSSLLFCVFVDWFYQRRTAKYRDSYNTGGFFYINTSNCFLQCYSDL